MPDIPSDNHGWVYATDALLPHYKADSRAATAELSRAFQDVLRKTLNLHGATPGDNRRFIDKSQTFTLRVGLIAELLKGCDPRFVLMSRNPYAMIWRAVTRVGGIADLPFDQEHKP